MNDVNKNIREMTRTEFFRHMGVKPSNEKEVVYKNDKAMMACVKAFKAYKKAKGERI